MTIIGDIGGDSNVPPRKEEKPKVKSLELMSLERWQFECVNKRGFIPGDNYEWSQLEHTKIKYE